MRSLICFYTDDAIEYGIAAACIMSDIRQFLSSRDDIWFDYNEGYMEKLYPFLSESEISIALLQLQRRGAIIVRAGENGVTNVTTPEILNKPKLSVSELKKSEKPKTTDHLYVFKRSNFYKIGRTKYIDSRLKALNIASYEPITYVFHLPEQGTLEKKFHKIFHSKRMNTEWFALEESDLYFIKNYTTA
jgi:hypothetical protein